MDDSGRLVHIFDELSELEPEQQLERLKTIGQTDPALSRRLAPLLDAHRRTGGVLDDDVVRRWASVLAEFEPESLVGTRIGAYRIDELIGRGGMSVVYGATRIQEEVEQSVALKLLALPIFDQHAANDFMGEAAILSRLDHPAIARLLDWGRTENGWPYLALERVRGKPIDEWCAEQRLRLSDRLELMERVAGAMAYAHRNLVVHLDLKPANVLINEHGRPVVLDFGIARVIADKIGGGDTLRTRWLTPQYASPEQIAGRPARVAADVYALGAMVYELATGHPPFDFDRASPFEAVALIEAGPVPPSRRVRKLPRDLDAVCLRALHPDPDQRYPSAEALAADLAAVRETRPVKARPDGVGYRLRKALARHPLTLPAAIAAGLTILALSAVLAFQTADLRVQRDHAEHQRDRAEAVTQFLIDSIEAVSPRALSETGIGLSELMETTAARLTRDPPSDPALRLALFEQIARTRQALGEHQAALAAVDKALQTSAALAAPADEARLLSLKAAVLRSLARYDEALDAADRAVTLATGPELVVEARRRRAQVLERMMRSDEAEAYGHETLELIGEDHPLLRAHVLNDLATNALSRMDMATVETHAARALELYQQIHAEPHMDTSEAAWRLAAAYLNTGRTDQALPLLDEALELRTALFGPDDHRVGEIHYAYSHALPRLGQFEQALEHARTTYRVYSDSLLPDDPRLMAATGNLGTALKDMGREAEAIEYFTEAIAQGTAIHNDRFHPDLGAFHNQLAEIHIHRGEYEAALAIYESLLPVFLELAGEPSVPVAFIRRNLSRTLRGLGRPDQALAHAESAAGQAAEIYSPDHFMTAGFEAELGECLLALGRTAEADEIAGRLEPLLNPDASLPPAQRIPIEAFYEQYRLQADASL